MASSNPFALVVLTARLALNGKKVKKENRDKFLLDLKLNLAKELLSRKISKNKIRVLMNFLRYYVRFSDPGNNSIFEQELQKLTGRSNTMGIEELLLDRAKNEGIAEGKAEGVQQGRQAERAKMLAKALKEKKTIARNLKNKGIDLNIIADATGLSFDEIQAL